MSRPDEILQRAEELLAEASLEDLLQFVSPESLAKGSSFSAAAVRYHFGADGRKFSRSKLADALLERMAKGNLEAAEVAITGYRYASVSVEDFSDAHKVIEGILADVSQYYGSMLAEDVSTAARERMYLMAVLTSEREDRSAGVLRDYDDEVLGRYADIYELYLDKVGRKLAKGLSTRDFAHLISLILLGATFVGRYSADEIDMQQVAQAVIRIFWAFTYDPATQAEPAYEQEIDI